MKYANIFKVLLIILIFIFISTCLRTNLKERFLEDRESEVKWSEILEEGSVSEGEESFGEEAGHTGEGEEIEETLEVGTSGEEGTSTGEELPPAKRKLLR